ncbi:MAG: PAS domain S-box protein [Deltaproteobacteria bacterium]|nr:PAS domain S-box protein [Deltaproteobacteria bacterium]
MTGTLREHSASGPVRFAVLEPDLETADAIGAVLRQVSDALALEARPGVSIGDSKALFVIGPGGTEENLQEVAAAGSPALVLIPAEHAERAPRLLTLGADDVLVYASWAQAEAELALRVRRVIERRRTDQMLQIERRDLGALLALSEALTDSRDIEGTLGHIARQVAEVMLSERCSVILLDDEGELGYVVAASDDPNIQRRQISLAHYPEIQEVIRTKSPLVIPDVQRDPRFEGVWELLRSKRVGNTALFPIHLDAKVVGVIHARGAAVRTAGLSEHQLRFGNIVANSAAIAVRNARLFQSIRDRAERVLSARLRAERRMKQLEKYQRFFDLAGDGLVIVDGRGRILFANREACAILGFDAADVTQIRLLDLVQQEGAARLEELLEGFRRGFHRNRIDLPIIRASGAPAILSLSTASLDQDEGSEGAEKNADIAAIISFRDVTETRRMEIELRKTKDFLENLIESTHDAIVAADIKGRILIFNGGAERITGHHRQDVIGKASVEILYRPGVAREIMRRLRSPEPGGVGRYQSAQEELIARDGGTIPIALAAALIYDQGREIASVGIFSDLRERLRMEQELAQAQRQLELSERQSAVVELAGAAAHELSQPLTSILGSAELMARKLAPEAPTQALLGRILAECERMAEIVKNIGRITRYETKPYVGMTNILDLDASSSQGEDKR